MSYLLDENVDAALHIGLLKRNPELLVWKVGEFGTPPLRTPDPQILEWCERNVAILVTNNRHSMPVHLTDHIAAGRHVPGIFILNNKMSIGNSIEELLLIDGASYRDEYRDRLVHLPVSYSLSES